MAAIRLLESPLYGLDSRVKKVEYEGITLANQKGGCGKTTAAVNLAAYLALKGKSTSNPC